jgi:CubicO group peptidase (beta-lactamase class C family)
MPPSEHKRLAVLEDAPMPPEMMAQMADMPKDLPMFKAAPMSLMPNAAFGNDEGTLAADIPAGGKVTARAIAKMYAALLGKVDGVRLLTPERLREATTVAFSGPDQVFGMPTTWALGYSIGGLGSGGDSIFGVGGVGGSFACGDTATGISFALTKNRLTQDFNASTQTLELVMKALS